MKEPMYSKLPHSHSPIGKDVELLIDFLTEIFASKKQEIIHADCDVGLIDLHLVRQPLWSVFSFPFTALAGGTLACTLATGVAGYTGVAVAEELADEVDVPLTGARRRRS